jgi:predicted ATP-dependent endonuclease of OLD family
MRLKKVRIQTYRSIVDSGEVEIEDGVTVVIGKNEQGKTNFLKAIRSFNADQRFSPSDLPNHLRPALEDRESADIPIVTLWFSVEPEDRTKLKGALQGIDQITELKCIKDYGNNYQFAVVGSDGTQEPLKYAPPEMSSAKGQMKKTIDELKSKLQAHSERVPAFAANADKVQQITSALQEASLTDGTEAENSIKTFTTSIKSLTAQDQPITDDITAAIKELDTVREAIQLAHQHDPARVLKQSLPSFILHSTKSDHIPNEVNVSDFVKDPDAFSKGMSNLCRAAGLSVQKIRELAATTDTSQREAYEDHYKGTISGGLNEFWTQAEYHVHFRIEKERLSVSISDGTYTQRIPPSDRSEGFQWYLSFYATLLNDVGVSNQTVLLLDNPGLELHLDGQRDIKRFLEEKVALTSQVLYVTHSPAMIEPFNLRQVRTVELHGNQNGTKIANFVAKQGDDSDLLEPVRAAIGMSLVTSLVLNEWNVLVEGAADKPIVEGIFFTHYQELQGKVLVNGSLSETKDAFLARFYHRTGLPYVIVLDADSGGRELLAELRRSGIPEDRVVRLEQVFEGRQGDFAMEDILSANVYHQAVLAAYPSNQVPMPAPGNRKRTTLYEDAFRQTYNIGFNKRRVAEAVKKLLNEKREDEETKNNLGTLSTAITEKLKAQVPQAEAAAAGEVSN